MTKEQRDYIESIAKDIKELENFADDIKADIESKKDIIKGIMTMENESDIKTDIFHIVWNEVFSDTFDKKACEKDHADIIKAYTVTKKSRPFRII